MIKNTLGWIMHDTVDKHMNTQTMTKFETGTFIPPLQFKTNFSNSWIKWAGEPENSNEWYR